MYRFIIAIYAIASILTFILFGWDKWCAQRDRRRVPEKTLHTFELLGGFPGAFLAMHLFKHKRRKTRYLVVFWAIVALHGVAWAAWMAWSWRAGGGEI